MSLSVRLHFLLCLFFIRRTLSVRFLSVPKIRIKLFSVSVFYFVPINNHAEISTKGNIKLKIKTKVKFHLKKHINGQWKPEARNRTRPSF